VTSTIPGSSTVGIKWKLQEYSGGSLVYLSQTEAATATKKIVAYSLGSSCTGSQLPPPSGKTTLTLFDPATNTTGNSGSSFSTSGNQFVYNWNAKGLTGCYEVVLTLADGALYATNVQF
jgi:hypothetical protein